MSKWTIEALPAARREVKSLPRDLQARFFQIGDMLMEHGPQQVGMPHVRHLEGDLWEMRMKGKSGIARAIYFTVVGKRIIVCSAFVKKSQKTPKKELDKARNRMKGFEP
jgi:phage-related protein